jgi:hypothetical protein
VPDLDFLDIAPLTGVAAQVAEVWAMACDGMGGLRWRDVEWAARYLRVDDTELLVDGLMTIKTHRRNRGDDDDGDDDDAAGDPAAWGDDDQELTDDPWR